MHPVSALLTSRSRPEGTRLALAIEGGGSRGAYSGGMVAALADLGLSDAFDAVYGASAGALNGAWFLAGQTGPGVQGWSDPAIMRRVTNPWRALRRGPVVDTHHLVHTVYESVPMDFAAILANRTTFHPLATSAATGAAVDLRPHITDQRTLQLALRASTGLPLLSGAPVDLAGTRWVDAGLSEAVPLRTPLTQGATHVLLLRTRRVGEVAPPPSTLESAIVTRYLRRTAPGALDAWRTRRDRHTEDERTLSTNDRVLEIRPPADAPPVGRLSRDPDLLGRAVAIGWEAAVKALT